jgi:small subunit ribosomal protein S8
MKTTDPIADLLTRIRNAHLAKHDRLDVPASKLKLEVCRILKEEGYIRNFRMLEAEGARRNMRIFLNYAGDGEPIIRRLRRVSKPGRRVYRRADEIPPVLNGLGIGIVSTSRGLMTDKQARERRVGGEILCEVW